MDIKERLRQIREYRHLSQDDIARLLGISKQAWGKKERGEVAGFSPEDFHEILKKTEIDARWLFGQMPEDVPIQAADLQLKKTEATYAELVDEIRQLKQQYQPPEKDPLLSKVRNNAALRSILEEIQHLDATKLNLIEALIYGYLRRDRQGSPETKRA